MSPPVIADPALRPHNMEPQLSSDWTPALVDVLPNTYFGGVSTIAMTSLHKIHRIS